MRSLTNHNVTGNAMEPHYLSGDIVATQSMDIDSYIEPGEAYLIDTDQGEILTKLSQDPDDENYLRCNFEKAEEFPSFRIPKSSILYIGKVTGLIRSTGALVMSYN